MFELIINDDESILVENLADAQRELMHILSTEPTLIEQLDIQPLPAILQNQAD